MLVNSGLIDKIKPRHLLVESAERYCSARFSGEIDFNATEDENKLVAHFTKEIDPFTNPAKIIFINNANFKYIYYRFLYLYQMIRQKKSP